MSNNFFLTVAIPVYNGEMFLEEAILSVLKQIENNDIEILLVDNNSSDNTSEIAKRFKEVRYVKHETNIGYDRNVNSLFKYAHGKYVWILAADDIIQNGYLMYVLDILKRNEEIALAYVGGVKESIKLNEKYVVTKNGDEYFYNTTFQNGGVSSNIIKRSKWEEGHPEQYIGTGWIHFGVVVELAAKNKGIVFKDAIMIENPKSSKLPKTWDTNGANIYYGLSLVEIFKQSMEKGNYSRSTYKNAINVIKSSYPRQIFSSKVNGLKINNDIILRFIKAYWNYPSFWLIDLLVLISPTAILKSIKKRLRQIERI